MVSFGVGNCVVLRAFTSRVVLHDNALDLEAHLLQSLIKLQEQVAQGYAHMVRKVGHDRFDSLLKVRRRDAPTCEEQLHHPLLEVIHYFS